ncbi:arsenate reductase (glutaredoxin) [Halomonas sp. 18H]|uniref:ArsC/Spx/MgsR family protein n=1 Tax=Halomonas almeriensis TaxID=308163 RepID=UPI002232C188|nr:MULTISPECIES: ArsC/Spx/MgsR family protein [Halomonas]MCW4151886.1 arsenate reductase (glutaredoxin) [Halomonas sp. 18H]MDN3554132.1 ArsC/Spx/MgsR family protein [Halomonas almeriensis]
MLTLLHNPRCSKSRQTLALLEERHLDMRVRRYLDEPLDEAELRALLTRLEADSAALVRTQEPEWKQLGADPHDAEQVIQAIAAHPRILQRPIADDGQRAIIGRPTDAVLSLLDGTTA